MDNTNDNKTLDMNSVKVFMDLYGIKAAFVADKIGMSKAGFANNFNPNQSSNNFTLSQKQKAREYLLAMQKDLAKLVGDTEE